MKVLMLPKHYPNRLDHAEGNYVQRHILSISKLVQVAVLYVHSDNNLTKNQYEIVFSNEHQIPVVKVFFRKASSGWTFIDNSLNLFRYLKAQSKGYDLIIKEFGMPSLVHVHLLTRTCVFALYLKWTHGIRFIISEHWSGFLRERKALKGTLKTSFTKWLAARAEYITCVSDSLALGMKEYGFKNDFKIIPNVVDTAVFKMNNEKVLPGKKKLLHVSRLDAHTKNLPGILAAVKDLSLRRNDFELHLLGDGIEATKQKILADTLGLLNRTVFFHGYKTSQEVADFMKQACCIVVFSKYETQSCVVLEAFASGTPVIATNAGGIPEIVNPCRGFLVEGGNIKDLADAMNEMLDTYEDYASENIRQFATDNFSVEIIGKKFLDVYHASLSKNPPALD